MSDGINFMLTVKAFLNFINFLIKIVRKKQATEFRSITGQDLRRELQFYVYQVVKSSSTEYLKAFYTDRNEKSRILCESI